MKKAIMAVAIMAVISILIAGCGSEVQKAKTSSDSGSQIQTNEVSIDTDNSGASVTTDTATDESFDIQVDDIDAELDMSELDSIDSDLAEIDW